jgi:hypothetical protein
MSCEAHMKKDISHHYAKSNGRHRLLLLLAIMFTLLSVGTQLATAGDLQRYHESGELTDVENNDSVIIDARGYDVDPSVLVVNAAGRPVSLDDLSIPTKVIFDYTYMKSGPKTMSPVIIYIEEAKKNGNNGRNMQ